MEKVVAVTGCWSFLGANIIARLQNLEDIRIVAIDLSKPDFLNERSKFYRVDLTDPASDIMLYEILDRENVDTFVHLAFFRWLSKKSLSYFHEVEVIGTYHVLSACARKKIKKFVLRSWTGIYGADPMNPALIREDRQPRIMHSNKHMRDRLEAEMLVQEFSKKQKDIQVFILRHCTALGPNIRNHMTWYLSGAVVFTILGYDPMIQFIHEEDAIDSLILTVLDDKPPGIYNVVGRGALPLSYIVRLAGKLNFPIPHSLAYLIMLSMWNSGMSPISPEYINYFKYTYVADGTKSEKELGFLPRYSTKDTVEEFVGLMRLKNLRIKM